MEQYDISLIMEVVDVSETVIPNFVTQLNRCGFVFIRDLIRKSSLCYAKANFLSMRTHYEESPRWQKKHDIYLIVQCKKF